MGVSAGFSEKRKNVRFRHLPFGRSLIWASAMALILFSITVGWLILTKIDTQTRQETYSTLDTVLKTTQEALHNWVRMRMTEVTGWAFSPELRRLVKAQLEVPRNREALLNSPVLSELRTLLKPTILENDFAGFFIITPEWINVGSMRDSNIGAVNLLSEHDDFLSRVFDGNVLISQLLVSDVLLPSPSGELAEGQPTMFVAAPIMDNGSVLAVLTFRIDPSLHFTRITQLGRVGKTGETYAFDENGKLITESRFDDQLRQIGLLSPGKRGILNIEIRDPGGNLPEGFQPALPRQEQPLTYMAQQAIAGQTGVNLDGYRDYRGVPVVGTWLWNEELGFGLTTEIDVDEAYQSYRTTRWAVMLSLGLTMALSLILSFTLDSGRRRALHLASQIQEKRTHLQAILKNMAEGIITINEEGIVQSFNPAAERIFGYQADEIIGQPINLLMPDPYKSEHDDYIKKYLFTGQASIFGQAREVPGMRKDGSIFPLEFAVSEMILGKRRWFIGVLRDMTERKRLEGELRKLSQAVEQSPCSIIITDIKGNIEYVNPKFTRVTGYSAEEVMGKNPRFLKSGETASLDYKGLWKTITAGGEWLGEFHNKKRNGELFWELASISAIKNERGVITHFLAIKEDISWRKLAELKLRDETEFKHLLKDVAVAANEAVFLEDAVQVCLDNVCKLTGWPVGHLYLFDEDAGELIPTEVWHLDEPERFATFKSITEATRFLPGIGLPGRVLTSGQPAWIVDVNKDPNFPRAKLANNLGVKAGFGFPILTGKKVVAVLEFFSTEAIEPDDALLEVMVNIGTQLGRITERKRAEEKLRQSHQELRNLFNHLQTVREEERTRIAREVHDELGQTLTALKIDLSWVEKKLPKNQKLLLKKTRSMAGLMDQTIQNVQRISSELRPEVLDVLGLSEAIEWHAQEFQKRTGIRCDLNLSFRDIDFEPDLGTALFRILQETLTNVARHAKASKIAIKFCEDNGNMVLQIADNGKGISESQISDPKSLGLLGMKERALLWDGEVQIRGSQGQGTTITVRIPRG